MSDDNIREKKLNKNDEILEKIDNLQTTVNSLVISKSEKLATTDDSLFFGLVITLVILSIPLPTGDLSQFFNLANYINPAFPIIDAAIFPLVATGVLFIAFSVSAVSRYYGAIMFVFDPKRSMKLRYLSMQSFIFGLAWFLAIGFYTIAAWFIPSDM